MGKADLHIHTKFSDGVNNPESVLKLAKRRGLDVVAITDHNTLDGAYEAKKFEKKFGVEVVVGEEVSTKAGHVVGLFIEHVIPRDLEPDETIRRIHRQGGVAVIPHPLASAPRSISLNVLDQLVNHYEEECRPDVLEVMNGFPWNFSRHKQLLSLNEEFGLAVSGGSDSHGPVSVGCIWTEFIGSTASDLREALFHKSTKSCGSPWPMLEMMRALGKDAIYRSRKIIIGQN